MLRKQLRCVVGLYRLTAAIVVDDGVEDSGVSVVEVFVTAQLSMVRREVRQAGARLTEERRDERPMAATPDVDRDHSVISGSQSAVFDWRSVGFGSTSGSVCDGDQSMIVAYRSVFFRTRLILGELHSCRHVSHSISIRYNITAVFAATDFSVIYMLRHFGTSVSEL